MRAHVIGAALVASSLAVTSTGPLSAQQKQTPAPALQPDPSLKAEDQLAPSQMAQPMPAPVAAPAGAANPVKRAAAPPANPKAANLRTVSCGGPFSKDSSSLKLAMTFDSRNVTFADIDFKGSKIGASILFPNDPKRRLEIWWSNPANRSGIYLVLINGQSGWSAPGGLRLGLTLADLEKINHKPFKLKGFDADHVATVTDWNDGALAAAIPGGCKSGVSLQPGSKVPAETVSALPADHEYSSSDPEMRDAKPTVSEILVGY